MFYISKLQEHYFTIFKQSQNICDLFAWFSVYVWEQLEFAAEERNDISKVDERTLTNDLVSCIAKLIKKDGIPLPIRLFHSPNEKANGSDLEIVLRVAKDKNIIFACQAKRLYVESNQKNNSNATYTALGHGKENLEPQIELLLKYAQINQAFPLYLLYNYTQNEVVIDEDCPKKELYGCTLVSANYLKDEFYKKQDLEKLRFQDLHPPAESIITLPQIKELKPLIDRWGLDLSHNTIFHSDQKILDKKRWYEMNPPRDPNRFVHPSIDLKKALSIQNGQNLDLSFNPKFRILLTDEPIYFRKSNFTI